MVEVTVKISIVIVLVVVVLIIGTLIRDNMTNFSGIRSNCPSGYCATSRITGVKRCPSSSSGRIEKDVTLEVCNPREFCTDPQTPFASLKDGSTDALGRCDNGVECSCTKTSRCPNYILSFFEAKDGDSITLLNEPTRFQQEVAELITKEPPLSIDNPFTQLCSVPLEFLERAWPRSCTEGVLGFISEDASDDVNEQIPLACLRTKRCIPGEIPRYIKNEDRSVCISRPQFLTGI